MFMLDTNVFNRVLDGAYDPTLLSLRGQLLVTHIQLDEITATSNTERRNKLLSTFKLVEHQKILTAAGAWNVTQWSDAQWTPEDGSYNAMLASLDKRNKNKKNNTQDILIGLTVVKGRYTLVTDDSDLAAVVKEFGGASETFDQFSQHAR